ncbi:MAG TPA: protein-L-isoaspartate(D-aspartate) O-methyltransferase [Bacteroidales bacterium]|nr:protein-L-isoaspartate(D-aspartate) O-methyltransferase [Bacteroidales bacterium]
MNTFSRITGFFLIFLLGPATEPVMTQDYSGLRDRMVREQIIARGVTHKATLQAVRKVERHLFVDESLRKRAYDDNPLPIGYGQTISQPFIVAYMTSLIDPQPHFKVLEIGTGSGYQAAILAQITEWVYTMEIVPELGKQAKKRLHNLHYDNIEVITGDGYYGLPEKGPFDAIVVTAAAEHVPPPLIEQLKDGGKMIIPVGSPFMVQSLVLVTRKKGRIRTENLMSVRFVPFTRKENE